MYYFWVRLEPALVVTPDAFHFKGRLLSLPGNSSRRWQCPICEKRSGLSLRMRDYTKIGSGGLYHKTYYGRNLQFP
jgi:hypothetical protein